MPFVLEFGVKGGAHVDNVVVPTAKLAETLARNLVGVFTNDSMHPAAKVGSWDIFREYRTDREWWESPTHFVCVSRLGRTLEGPASATLWKRK